MLFSVYHYGTIPKTYFRKEKVSIKCATICLRNEMCFGWGVEVHVLVYTKNIPQRLPRHIPVIANEQRGQVAVGRGGGKPVFASGNFAALEFGTLFIYNLIYNILVKIF